LQELPNARIFAFHIKDLPTGAENFEGAHSAARQKTALPSDRRSRYSPGAIRNGE
jgi:hypothetical protein